MALNIISNYAANVAHRNLTATDMRTTDSLAKLSSGSRVVTAKDDAASLAIGKGLQAQVESLKQAQVNAGQASSMLQIADGALATISDITIRMRTLAIQASSGQLGSTERTFLNNEFTALRSEIDRIAQDTEFNGTTLLSGSTTFSAGTIGTNIEAADGFEQFVFGNNPGGTYLSAGDTVQLDYAANVLTVTNQTTGSSQTATVSAAPSAGSFLEVNFSDFGLTVELNSLFNDAGTVSANNTFIVGGAASNSLQLTFRVGTGTGTTDEITIDVTSARVSALDAGLSTASLTTVANAETAIGSLDTAIETVNTLRANIGTSQNRVAFAAANLASTVENSEAARSNLLDLDVAREMSYFTSQQVLLQAGVSMLAQANQMPQNLLALLRG
ncbi:MAG: flagellin [Alphaproteobacteria bacterium]